MIIESIWKHHRFDAETLEAAPAEDVRRFAGFEMPLVQPPQGLMEASSVSGAFTKTELGLVKKYLEGRFLKTFRPLQSDFVLGRIFLRPGVAQPLLEAVRMRDDSIPMLKREEFVSFEAGEEGMTEQQKLLRRIVVLLNGDDNSKARGLVYLLRRFRDLEETSPEYRALLDKAGSKPVVDPRIVEYLRRSIRLRRKLAPVGSNAILRQRWNGNRSFVEADRNRLSKLLRETLRTSFLLESLAAIGQPSTDAGIADTLMRDESLYAAAEDHFNGKPHLLMSDFDSGRLLFEPLTSREVRRPISAMLKQVLQIGRQAPLPEVFRKLLVAIVQCQIEEDEMEQALGFLVWYALRRPSESYQTALDVDAEYGFDVAALFVSSIPYQRLRIDAESLASGDKQPRIRTRPATPAAAAEIKAEPVAAEQEEAVSAMPDLFPEDATVDEDASVEAVDPTFPVSSVRTEAPLVEPAGQIDELPDFLEPASSSEKDDADLAEVDDSESEEVSADTADAEEASSSVEPEETPADRVEEPAVETIDDDVEAEEPVVAAEDGVPAAARLVMGDWEARIGSFIALSSTFAKGTSVLEASAFATHLETMLTDVRALGDAYASAAAPIAVDDLLVRILDINERIFEISGGETEPLEIPATGHVHPDRRPDMEACVVEGELHAGSATEINREAETIQASIFTTPLSKRREIIGRLDGLTSRIQADTTTAWRAIEVALSYLMPAAEMPSTMPTLFTPAAGEAADTSAADPESVQETVLADVGAPHIDASTALPTQPDTAQVMDTSSYPNFAAQLRREAAANGFDSAYKMGALRPHDEAADMAQEILQAVVMPGRVEAEKFLEPDVASIFEMAALRLNELPVEWRGTGDLLAAAALEGALFNPGAVYTEILDSADGSGPVAKAAYDLHQAIRNKITWSGIPSVADFKQARDILAARAVMVESRAAALETMEILRNAQFTYKAAGVHSKALSDGYFNDLILGMEDAEKHRDADPLFLEQARRYSNEKQAGQMLDEIAREEGTSNLERGGRTKFAKAIVEVSKSVVVYLEAIEKSSFDGAGFDELIEASAAARESIANAGSPTLDPFNTALLLQAETVFERFHDLVTGNASRPA
jgi:hypothetical protein